MVCSAGAWLIWLLPFEDNRLVIFTQLKAQDPGFLPSEGMGLYLLTPFKAKGPPCLLGSRELSRVTPLSTQNPGALPVRKHRALAPYLCERRELSIFTTMEVQDPGS